MKREVVVPNVSGGWFVFLRVTSGQRIVTKGGAGERPGSEITVALAVGGGIVECQRQPH